MENINPSDNESQDRPDEAEKPGAGKDSSRQILVPLDGSALAEMALPHAIALARASSSNLLLARVVPPLGAIEPGGGLIGGSPELWEAYEEQPKIAREYLEEVAGRLAPYQLQIDTWVADGLPADSILQYVYEHPEVEAIAMSTHGRSGLGRWLFGSVAERILHGSPVPLLLLRPEAEPEQVDLEHAAIPEYRTVLVPLDGSQLSENAVAHALGLAQATNGRLILISVTSTPFDLKLVKQDLHAPWSAVPWNTPAERLVEYLDGIEERLGEVHVPVEARVTYGDPADEVLKAAKYEKADIIVMATHGRSGLGHLLIGSVAGRVAQAATVPLLLVRVGKQSRSVQHTEPAQLSRRSEVAAPR